jgi:hypothetical protein
VVLASLVKAIARREDEEDFRLGRGHIVGWLVLLEEWLCGDYSLRRTTLVDAEVLCDARAWLLRERPGSRDVSRLLPTYTLHDMTIHT